MNPLPETVHQDTTFWQAFLAVVVATFGLVAKAGIDLLRAPGRRREADDLARRVTGLEAGYTGLTQSHHELDVRTAVNESRQDETNRRLANIEQMLGQLLQRHE